tara:strand:- start:502 stop:807 length:306 start_codon:yes stop_codon:yes gene_type:complete
MKFSLETSLDIKELIRELSHGLYKLSLEENMEAFKVEDLKIGANSEVQVKNKLKFTPKQYIITSQQGGGLITKSDKDWKTGYLSLTNSGSTEATITVIFMR